MRPTAARRPCAYHGAAARPSSPQPPFTPSKSPPSPPSPATAVFLVVADEAYGRQIPFAYLARARDAFVEKFGEKGITTPSHGLDRAFGPAMKKQMEYCMEHPEEISKVANVQRQVRQRAVWVHMGAPVCEGGMRGS